MFSGAKVIHLSEIIRKIDQQNRKTYEFGLCFCLLLSAPSDLSDSSDRCERNKHRNILRCL